MTLKTLVSLLIRLTGSSKATTMGIGIRIVSLMEISPRVVELPVLRQTKSGPRICAASLVIIMSGGIALRISSARTTSLETRAETAIESESEIGAEMATAEAAVAKGAKGKVKRIARKATVAASWEVQLSLSGTLKSSSPTTKSLSAARSPMERSLQRRGPVGSIQ